MSEHFNLTAMMIRRGPGGSAAHPVACVRLGMCRRTSVSQSPTVRPRTTLKLYSLTATRTRLDNGQSILRLQRHRNHKRRAQHQRLPTDWSAWVRAEGVQYRYRASLNPQAGGQLDAIFEVHNLQNRRWQGSVRSADCHQKTLSADAKVELNAGETRQAAFRTHNCGTATNPFFIPGIAADKVF